MPDAPNPVKGEAEFTFAGETYRFTFPWAAVVEFERSTDLSLAQFMAEMHMVEHGGPWPKIHHLGEFMRAGLMTHHPEMTAEKGAEIVLDPGAKRAAMEALGNSMPGREAGEPGEGSPARSRSGGSKKSSANGSKRAGKKKASGGRRRA